MVLGLGVGAVTTRTTTVRQGHLLRDSESLTMKV